MEEAVPDVDEGVLVDVGVPQSVVVVVVRGNVVPGGPLVLRHLYIGDLLLGWSRLYCFGQKWESWKTCHAAQQI